MEIQKESDVLKKLINEMHDVTGTWSVDQMVTHVWQAAKASVAEGFVLVSHKDLLDLTVAINAVDLATHTDSKTNEVREIWQTIAIKLSSLGEAQEQK